MIPYFTPSTARRDIGRLVGDAELAKLANLNKLIEDINAIVAIGGTSGTSGGGSSGSGTSGTSGVSGGTGSAGTNGTSGVSGGIGSAGSAGSAGTAGTSGTSPNPSLGPEITYTVGGTLTSMGVSFALLVDPDNIPVSNSTKTVQSTYGPGISLNGLNGQNSALTSIVFPDTDLIGSGGVSVSDIPSLTTISFPIATKSAGGILASGVGGGQVLTLNTPLLTSVGSVNLTNVAFDLSLLTYISSLTLTQVRSNPNFPLVEYIRGGVNILSGILTMTSIDFSSLISVGVIGNSDYNFTIDQCPATELKVPLLTYGSNHMYIYNCPNLTSLSFPSLTSTNYQVDINACQYITSISLPVYSGTIGLYDLPAVTSLTLNGATVIVYLNGLPALPSLSTLSTSFEAYLTDDQVGTTGITTVSAPNATTFKWHDNRGSNIATVLESASAPLATDIYFRTANEGAISELSPFASADFPSVTYVYRMKIRNCSITTLDLSTVITYNVGEDIDIDNNPYLTSAIIGVIGTLKSIGSDSVRLENNALTETCVNDVLALLVSLDGTNGTTEFGSGKYLYLEGGTNSAPTGQGILDVATLTSRGCTVTTN
jgi:hypothetical protein